MPLIHKGCGFSVAWVCRGGVFGVNLLCHGLWCVWEGVAMDEERDEDEDVGDGEMNKEQKRLGISVLFCERGSLT